MDLLVSLWLFWLMLWVVFTVVLVRQSRQLLKVLASEDESFEFKGWRILLSSIWRRSYQALPEGELRNTCDDYRKLLNIWVFMAVLVILVRLMILVTNV
ncbi:hypothetical protein GCM10011369_31180 [Neiella marina]|uniref:Uncharacterized protein n=1 Tax=Neiella marina TaxID=508461 RepID=A0A8J2U8T0_9GAMM|nr:hypothetical protein [Neiella marina]GGA86902.1 hypothetical protein GCM10011369_31180 [Neiella marina]